MIILVSFLNFLSKHNVHVEKHKDYKDAAQCISRTKSAHVISTKIKKQNLPVHKKLPTHDSSVHSATQGKLLCWLLIVRLVLPVLGFYINAIIEHIFYIWFLSCNITLVKFIHAVRWSCKFFILITAWNSIQLTDYSTSYLFIIQLMGICVVSTAFFFFFFFDIAFLMELLWESWNGSLVTNHMCASLLRIELEVELLVYRVYECLDLLAIAKNIPKW